VKGAHSASDHEETMSSATIPAVKKAIHKFDDDLEHTFEHIEDIVTKLEGVPQIALAYCFSQIENGHRRLLYAGIVRKYRLHPEMTWKFVLEHDITRKGFSELYKAVFKHEYPAKISEKLKSAEKIRDRMIHGKSPSTKEIWGSVINCFEYCEELNVHLREKEKFPGFGKMQGITGRRGNPTLGEPVSHLALVGLGLVPKN
jgi:hypothetical protein